MIIGDRPASACFAHPVGTKLVERIVAFENCTQETITDIQIIGPSGSSYSTLNKVPGSPDQWYENITWTPTQSQIGPNILCAIATSSSLLASDLSCFTVLVGITDPQIISASPFGVLADSFAYSSSGFLSFNIAFNVQILKPTKPAYIRIFSQTTNTEVYKVDASTISAANFQKNNLILNIPVGTLSPDKYYVLFDYGVGLGTEYCNPISEQITDKTFWNFEIVQLTTTTLPTTSNEFILNLFIPIYSCLNFLINAAPQNSCPNGTSYFNGNCYTATQNSTNSTAANEYCAAQGGHLLILNSQTEFDYLKNYLSSMNMGFVSVCQIIF